MPQHRPHHLTSEIFTAEDGAPWIIKLKRSEIAQITPLFHRPSRCVASPAPCRTSRSRGVCASSLTAPASTFPCRAKRRKHRPRPCAVRVRSQPPALRMLTDRGLGLFGDRGSGFGSTREHPPGTGGFGMSLSRQTPRQLRLSPRSGSGSSPAAGPRGELLQPVPVIPSPEGPGWFCGRKGAGGPSPRARGRWHGPPGHPGSLTSEAFAQDALQELAQRHEVRTGVGAGAAALPQPQHRSCEGERERAAPLGAQPGKGYPGTALQGPAGGSHTPARPGSPRLRPLSRAGTRVKFLEAPARPRRRSGQTGAVPAKGRSCQRCQGPHAHL